MFMILLLNPLKRELQIWICQCDCDSHSGSGNNLSPFNLVATTKKKTWKYSRCKKIPERHPGKIHNTNPSTVHLSRQKILESNPTNPEKATDVDLPTQSRPSRTPPAFWGVLLPAWLPTPAAPFGADLGFCRVCCFFFGKNSLAFCAFLVAFFESPPKKRQWLLFEKWALTFLKVCNHWRYIG